MLWRRHQAPAFSEDSGGEGTEIPSRHNEYTVGIEVSCDGTDYTSGIPKVLDDIEQNNYVKVAKPGENIRGYFCIDDMETTGNAGLRRISRNLNSSNLKVFSCFIEEESVCASNF